MAAESTGCTWLTYKNYFRLLIVIASTATILVGLTASVHRRIDLIERNRSTLPAPLVRTVWAATVLLIGSVSYLLYGLFIGRPRKLALVGYALTACALTAMVFAAMSSESITQARRERERCSYFDWTGRIPSGRTSVRCSGCNASDKLASTCCCCLKDQRCSGGTHKYGRCRGSSYEKTAFVGVESCEAVLSDSRLHVTLISSSIFYSLISVLFLIWTIGNHTHIDAEEGYCPSWFYEPPASSLDEQASSANSQANAELRQVTVPATVSSAEMQSHPAGQRRCPPAALEPTYATGRAANSTQSDYHHHRHPIITRW